MVFASLKNRHRRCNKKFPIIILCDVIFIVDIDPEYLQCMLFGGQYTF